MIVGMDTDFDSTPRRLGMELGGAPRRRPRLPRRRRARAASTRSRSTAGWSALEMDGAGAGRRRPALRRRGAARQRHDGVGLAGARPHRAARVRRPRRRRAAGDASSVDGRDGAGRRACRSTTRRARVFAPEAVPATRIAALPGGARRAGAAAGRARAAARAGRPAGARPDVGRPPAPIPTRSSCRTPAGRARGSRPAPAAELLARHAELAAAGERASPRARLAGVPVKVLVTGDADADRWCRRPFAAELAERLS